MQIVYRISPPKPTGKPRPGWFSKKRCLENCAKVFANKARFYVVADGVDDSSKDWFHSALIPLRHHAAGSYCLHIIQAANGAEAFLRALDYTLALDAPDSEIVYLLEDDYLHRPGAPEAIFEGLVLGFDYVTLYDHPDKYLDAGGPNPLVIAGAEDTRLFLGPRCHFKVTNSTTMTFACKLGTLRKDAEVFYKLNSGVAMPQSFRTFCKLRELYRTIGSAVPAYATHCETKWLSPLVDWGRIVRGY